MTSTTEPGAEPRVFLLSARQVHHRVTDAGIYEFEDLVCRFDAVTLHTPTASTALSRRIYTLANRVTRSPQLSCLLTPNLDSITLDRDYDLFCVNLRNIFETLFVNSVKNWRQRSRKAVCHIQECWVEPWLNQWMFMLEPLKQFDHIFVGTYNSVEAIAKYTGRPCSYLPFGVDAIKFCPHSISQARSIDVCAIGRRSAVTHQALLALADQQQIFYYYDTASNLHVMNAAEHRFMLANLLKRSRFFIANYSRVDEQTGNQGYEEIGCRFFEGAAAGTVMIGKAPSGPLFDQQFGWQDSVIYIPFDVPNIGEIIADLQAQPERLARIQRNNVVNSLLQHDWVYRWQQILAAIDLTPTLHMQTRKATLQELAESIKTEKQFSSQAT